MDVYLLTPTPGATSRGDSLLHQPGVSRHVYLGLRPSSAAGPQLAGVAGRPSGCQSSEVEGDLQVVVRRACPAGHASQVVFLATCPAQRKRWARTGWEVDV